MSTQYNKTIATLKTVEHDTKLLDAQKIKINPGSSDINERKDIVEFINECINNTLAETGGDVVASHSTAIATNTSNISSNTQDIKILQHYTSQLLNESLTQFTEFKTEDSLKKVNAVIRNTHSFRLDYEHVPQGIISEISIKNPESVPTLSNGEVSSANTEVYLIVKIYKGDNTSFPQLKNIVISKNKAKNNIENGEYTTWTFDNLLSPGPGEWMRVHCSTTPTTNHYTNTYITLPLNATSYHKNCGFNGDGTAWNDGRFYDPSFESSPMGKLSLSAPSKGLALVKFNGIFYKNIVSEKFVLPENSIYYSEYDTKTTTFDTSLESPGIANGSSISFSSDHTPDGLIKEIQIYNPSTGAANTTTSNDLYIIAKVYDIISDNKCKLAYSASSNNPARSNTGDNGTTSWYFDGFVAPGKNQFLKLYPSSDGMTVDTTKYIRIHLDETHYHKGCFVGGDTIVNGTYDDTTYNNQNKWLGFVKFYGDFYRKINDAEHVVNEDIHLLPIENKVIKELYTVSRYKDIGNTNINSAPITLKITRGFAVGRPYLINGEICRLSMPISGHTATTPNAKLILRLKDNNERVVKQLISKNAVSFSGISDATWDFDTFIIDNNIGYIDAHIANAEGNLDTSKQIVIGTIGNADNSGSELAKENQGFIPYIHFYGPSDFNLRISDSNLRMSNTNQYINNGILEKDVEEIITDLNDWMRKQIIPIRKATSCFENLSVGSSDKTTNINFNELREINSPSPFFTNFTTNGKVKIKFPVLEIISGYLFNNLTLHADLYIEMPNLESNNITLINPSGFTSNGHSVHITKPEDITINIS